MNDGLALFERVARRAYRITESKPAAEAAQHAFEQRAVHPELPTTVRKLFDDGHYAQATFEAFKFVDEEVQSLSGEQSETGYKLMMKVFNEMNPVLHLNNLVTLSEKDEQRGFRHLFAGATTGIRNPRGHSTKVVDDPDTCLDHLGLASLLLRRLEEAGIRKVARTTAT